MKFNKLTTGFFFCLLACFTFAGSITSLSPASAMQGESVTVTFNCTGAALSGDSVLSVFLVRETDKVAARSITVLNTETLDAVFNLPFDMGKGSWGALVVSATEELPDPSVDYNLHIENAFSVYNPDINGDGIVDLADFGTCAQDFLDAMPGYGIVPNLCYPFLTREQAENIIISAGFEIGTVREVWSSVARGFVESQSPAAGEVYRLDEGVTVSFNVSGTPLITLASIPNLYGMTREQAEAKITTEGYSVGEVTFGYSAAVAPGCVMGQDPAYLSNNIAYTYDKSEVAIDIVISNGVEGGVVPNVTGLAKANAESAVTSAGFSIGTISTEYNLNCAAGTVLRQTPLAGVEYVAGVTDSVDIVVSSTTPPITRIVPDIVGLTPYQADNTLVAAGFYAGTKTTFSVRGDAVCDGRWQYLGYEVTEQLVPAGTIYTDYDVHLVGYVYEHIVYCFD